MRDIACRTHQPPFFGAEKGQSEAEAPVGVSIGVQIFKFDPPEPGDRRPKNSHVGIRPPQRIVSPAIIPDIAQLNRAAIFKQLSDYRTGSRKSDIMAPVAESLNDRDMVDVIAYFAAPASSQGSLSGWSPSKGSIADLVERGVSNRGLPACASCHAMGAGGPIGAPALEGQRATYLEQQLKFFRTGERSNDIFGAMREIANKLTDTEIASVAKYYAAMH